MWGGSSHDIGYFLSCCALEKYLNSLDALRRQAILRYATASCIPPCAVRTSWGLTTANATNTKYWWRADLREARPLSWIFLRTKFLKNLIRSAPTRPADSTTFRRALPGLGSSLLRSQNDNDPEAVRFWVCHLWT